jgi:hypothetical protein
MILKRYLSIKVFFASFTIISLAIFYFLGNGFYLNRGFLLNIFSSISNNFPNFSISELTADGKKILNKGDIVNSNSIEFSVNLASVSIFPFKLQVEVKKVGVPFNGVLSGTSNTIFLSKTGKVLVSGLINGNYHWRARLYNINFGSFSDWKEFGNSNSSDFAISIREPVLIIPGITGTILERSSDNKELWPNVKEMVFSISDNYLDGLMLNDFGSDPQSSVKVGQIIKYISFNAFNEPLFKKDFYGNLIDSFKKDGYIENENLFTVPYDWRLSMEDSVSLLDRKINEAKNKSQTGKVNIVAHSMGGLLLKEYLSKYSNTNLHKIIFAGVPQFGVPYSYKILNYGDDLGVLVANRGEVKKIAQNMPSMYELLPSEKYIERAGSYLKDFRNGNSLYLNYNNSLSYMMKDNLDSRNSKLISLSQNFHNSIDNLSFSNLDVYNIVGCGLPTISGFNFYDNGDVDILRSDGDGTVPVASSVGNNDLKNYFVLGQKNGINHTGLASDPLTVGFMIKIIDGNENNSLPIGISKYQSQCSASDQTEKKFIEFSADNNIKMGVYDSQNRYTGIDSSGKLLLGIPNSSYDEISGNKFIMVPYLNNYKVVDKTDKNVDFSIKIKEYTGSKIDNKTSYFSIPLADSNEFAEMDFSGFDKNMGVKVGSYKNNSYKNIYYPDSTLKAYSLLNDFIPPSVSVKKKQVTSKVNTFSTLLFNANDIGSGVSSISAVLNGVSIKSGDSVLFKNKGENTLEVKAFDKAGNQSFRKINF